MFLDRVNIVSEYEEEVRSPTFSMRLPSVIALPCTAVAPYVYAVQCLLRDRLPAYCGDTPGTSELTFDHVIPRCAAVILLGTTLSCMC